jgi:hypothetical protein
MDIEINEQRQKIAKGRRPFFLSDPNSDKLLAILTALVGEFSILKDRLDTHERLAIEGKVSTPENIEAFIVTDNVEAHRDKARSEMLDRVFRIIKDQEVVINKDKNYDSYIDKFSKE